MGLDADAAYDPPVNMTMKNVLRMFPWYTWLGISAIGSIAVYGFIVAATLIGEVVVAVVR